MIIVTGSVRLREGARDAMVRASETMLEASRAEDGCVEYRYAFDIQDADVVVFAEVWTDMAALEAHFATPHMAAFQQATGELVDGSVDMTVFEGEETSFG